MCLLVAWVRYRRSATTDLLTYAMARSPQGRGRTATLAWKHPGMPTEWTGVIEEMPTDLFYPLPPGYVLLDARKDRPLGHGPHTWSSATICRKRRGEFGSG